LSGLFLFEKLPAFHYLWRGVASADIVATDFNPLKMNNDLLETMDFVPLKINAG